MAKKRPTKDTVTITIAPAFRKYVEMAIKDHAKVQDNGAELTVAEYCQAILDQHFDRLAATRARQIADMMIDHPDKTFDQIMELLCLSPP